MAIPQILKTRARELDIGFLTPTMVARRLELLNLKDNPDSTIRDILLAYLEYKGLNVTNYRIHGIKLIDVTDGDVYVLPRLLFVFVALFRHKKFPKLETVQ